jgi:hypothetical protein
VYMQRKIGGVSAPVISKENVHFIVTPDTKTKCLFVYKSDGSASINSGTFMDESVPPLITKTYTIDGKDISGIDYDTTKSTFDTVRNFFIDTVSPLFQIDYKKDLLEPTNKVESILKSSQNLIAQTLEFSKCPERKCSDPDILLAMMTAYNTKMSPKQISGGEGNTMKKILKAAISGPDTCDIMFENVYELYDDVLYPPLESYVDTKIYRFQLEMSKPAVCSEPFRVVTSNTAIFDISNMSHVINYDSTTLKTAFSIPRERTFNCRDPNFMRSVKARLEQSANSIQGSVTSYKAVTLSFQRDNTQCEYKMFKDLFYEDPRTGEPIQETEVETFIRVDLNYDITTGVATILNIGEFNDLTVDVEFNVSTGDYDYKMNGVIVAMPYLFSYDEKTASTRVNSDVYLF